MEDTSEITSTSEITFVDQIKFKEFLSKSTFWDFYQISREEYLNKDNQKQSLIINFYNEMVKGKS